MTQVGPPYRYSVKEVLELRRSPVYGHDAYRHPLRVASAEFEYLYSAQVQLGIHLSRSFFAIYTCMPQCQEAAPGGLAKTSERFFLSNDTIC